MFDRIDEGRWWDLGWQLVEGCTKCSPGCENCWSLAKEARFRKEIGVLFHPERLERPRKRKKPTSYSIWNDLFHPDVPFSQIEEVMGVIEECQQHIFMVLTKRPDIAAEYFNGLGKRFELTNLPNLWLGVTAENQEQADIRIPILLQIPAALRFVSVEPMLGSVDPFVRNKLEQLACAVSGRPKSHLTNPTPLLDWVIIGAESGAKRRKCEWKWADDLTRQCREAKIPVFVKQIHHIDSLELIKSPVGWPREMPKGVKK